jgi:hypothetical protein
MKKMKRMKKIFLLGVFAFLLSVNAYAHQTFTLVSSEKKTVKESDLANFDKQQTAGKKDKTNLTYTEKEIRLVVLTGPEDDMLSYRIQGVRNPNLIVPNGATLKILFVNSDVDMRHDVRFGHAVGDFPIAPEITETAGSQKLTARTEDGTLQAEEMVIKVSGSGAYKYFCSVRGHAKGGMWGNILVGVKPGADLKTAEKQVHVHSADEDKDHPHDEKSDSPKKDAPKSDKKPIDKKPDEEANHQHDKHKNSETKSETKPKTNTSARMNHNKHSAMRSTINIGDAMTRESSGTAWAPESSPMYARMKMYEDGATLMLHGTMFGRYKNVGSRRDVSAAGKGSRSRFDAPSMFMAMYSKPLTEKSQIGLRAMVSLDPIIERGYGYPLLYQSGELYRGEPIHDRQHPHDFVSELAASYSYKFGDKSSMFIYAGLPGEPALGPPTFMHRVSGMNNPDAPLSHHWQDATHITYGVVTAGYVYDKVKFEASVFNGTEPDENRWAFDKPKLNSFSGRFSFNPTKEWAFQISHGYLKNPERAEPEIKVLRRTTASAIYNKKFGEAVNLASAFVWGQNYAQGERTNSFLFEADYQFEKNAIFGRAESVEKSGHELVLDHPDDHDVYRVGAYSLGYIRELFRGNGLDLGIGSQVTFNTNPQSLVPYYGGTNHQGYQIFFRVRPSAMNQ